MSTLELSLMSGPSQEKPYDKIIKENIASAFLPIIEKLLKLRIQKIETMPISDKLPTTLERNPDFLKVVETIDKEIYPSYGISNC